MFLRRQHPWLPLRGSRPVVRRDVAAIYTCAHCGGLTKMAPVEVGSLGRDDGLQMIQLPVCLACLKSCPTCGDREDLCDRCMELLDSYEVPAPRGDA